MTSTPARKPSLRRSQIVFRWVLAILGGVAIWALRTVAANPTVSGEVTLPVRVTGVEQGGARLEPDPHEVNVTVLGRRDAIADELLQQRISAIVAAKDLTEAGDAPVTLLGAVPGVDLIGVAPERVALRALDSKIVPVRARATGPDAGSVTGAVASPSELKVTGPQDVIQRIVAVEAQVRAPTLLRQGWDDSYDIVLLGEGERMLDPTGVTLDPSRVRVEANALTAEVRVKVVLSGMPGEGQKVLSAEAEPARLRLSGPPELLNGLTEVETDPVDISGHTASFDTRVSIRPPKGLTPYRDSTVVVVVKLGSGRAAP